MKLKFVLIGLLFLFSQSLFGQVPDLGSYGYRLVKTVKDADFDYQRLESYFSDMKRLNALDTDAQAVFEPLDSEYTLHFFLGDLLSAAVDDTLRAYYPAAMEKQIMLVLKVMDSRVITDGFLFPYINRDKPLSQSLFRVRTKGLQLKKSFSLAELNLRNLYNKSLRADAGTVYVPEDVFWPYAESIKNLEVHYNLVKKVSAADFNPMFYDLDRFDTAIMNEGQDILEVFEPVAGDFIYYQFIADIVVNESVFPEHLEERDSFDTKLKTYEAPDDYLEPLVVAKSILILKIDTAGVIVDGYGFHLGLAESPASGNLRRVGQQGLRLRDGMPLYELALTGGSEIHGFPDDEAKLSLFPK